MSTEFKGTAEDVRREWPARLERVLRVRARIDTTGMTRPPRCPVKRRFLERTGQLGPFEESQTSSVAGSRCGDDSSATI